MKLVLNIYQKKKYSLTNSYGVMPISWFDAKLQVMQISTFLISKQQEYDNKLISQTGNYYIYTFKIPFKYRKQRKQIKQEIITLKRNISKFFYITQEK